MMKKTIQMLIIIPHTFPFIYNRCIYVMGTHSYYILCCFSVFVQSSFQSSAPFSVFLDPQSFWLRDFHFYSISSEALMDLFFMSMFLLYCSYMSISFTGHKMWQHFFLLSYRYRVCIKYCFQDIQEQIVWVCVMPQRFFFPKNK